MAFHAEAKDSDLHEPSRFRVINNTGGQLAVGTWVFIGVAEDSNGFIPISRVAAANERYVGLVTTAISTGATSTVQTLGRLYNVDTSSFSVNDNLALASSTAYQASTAASTRIGRVVVSNSTAGVINIDTVSNI